MHAILVLLVVEAAGTQPTNRVLPADLRPLPPAVAGTAISKYSAYLGTYDLGEHGSFGVTNPQGRLMGELSLRKGPLELFPTPGRPDQFYAKAAPATFVFSRNDKGRVDSLVISVAGKGDMKGAKRQ
jgi:hypothetical protein